MRFLPILLGASVFCAPHLASAGREISEGTLSVYFENDLFAGTDRYYTNGVKMSWSSADLAKFSDTPYASPLLPVLNAIPFVNSPDYQKNLTFSIGQNIYTPDNTEAFNPDPDDRPYAGWLYGEVGLVLKNANVRHTFALDIGVVGSYSYAQETQRIIHDLRGFDSPKGWDHQLHNELGIVGVYEIAWRWPRHEPRVGFGWDFIPHAGLAVGNVYDYVNLGGEFRLGLNLPDDFGTAGIAPGSSTSTPVEGNQLAPHARTFDLGLYVFARADGRAVARNIFLDGNTFGSSPSVDRKWYVADLSVGASVNYRNTKLTYALVYRTEEFETQEEGQLFGSVTVNLAF
jgi:lipid A 3-O-deacylase